MLRGGPGLWSIHPIGPWGLEWGAPPTPSLLQGLQRRMSYQMFGEESGKPSPSSALSCLRNR